jgi:hypothetical protein
MWIDRKIYGASDESFLISISSFDFTNNHLVIWNISIVFLFPASPILKQFCSALSYYLKFHAYFEFYFKNIFTVHYLSSYLFFLANLSMISNISIDRSSILQLLEVIEVFKIILHIIFILRWVFFSK